MDALYLIFQLYWKQTHSQCHQNLLLPHPHGLEDYLTDEILFNSSFWIYYKADKLTQAQGAKVIPLWRLYRVLQRGHTCVPS